MLGLVLERLEMLTRQFGTLYKSYTPTQSSNVSHADFAQRNSARFYILFRFYITLSTSINAPDCRSRLKNVKMMEVTSVFVFEKLEYFQNSDWKCLESVVFFDSARRRRRPTLFFVHKYNFRNFFNKISKKFLKSIKNSQNVLVSSLEKFRGN